MSEIVSGGMNAHGGNRRERKLPLTTARERTARALTRAFADDELEVEELERRLDTCYRASSVEELEALFGDLASPPVLRRGQWERTGVDEGSSPPASGDGGLRERRATELVLACLSGVRRSGRWTPAGSTAVVAFWGGAELDLRDALLPPGVTTLNVYAVMGGVEVIVPPGLSVETSGLPLMGGFDGLHQEGSGHAVLRIRGVACMGGVEVRVAGPDPPVPR